MKSITSKGIAIRFVFALLLVLLSYNPSTFSYYHWLLSSISEPTPWLALSAVALIIGWVIYVRATLKSLGPVGLTLAALLVAIIIWALIDIGLISLSEPSAFVWLLEIFISAILCLGMSWSHIRRRLSGQVDVDEV
ncbi:hypothetical protein A3740_01680 [Oleiphilus sp. HI0068]|jgi:energy-converting hydrogenase Eha subunit A|uniref:DUF6524 family protein n=1 Tax=unclassified Oleiphilus TaxID=2631174 RepID=UPI0007C327D4|nr:MULTISPECIES: DUF6524 family protein [unclassified Oleiphilus]KZY48569.1 hypothetical protein A3732_00710 [Oleiphilus sp. HI0050]KZY76831.1 hypothetical protein A3740_01680 [Oleiphilus sp. HI0068]KZY78823.1 hypothetical protein A3741_07870 [Oleiphilus sp. HI0069]KZZ32438.1 hypothetical protein A3755_01395 [Oleiphilus sp. HI0085]KZY65020.1 hypothetical protein A3735_08470 [Oleiphilus sp. HI0061]